MAWPDHGTPTARAMLTAIINDLRDEQLNMGANLDYNTRRALVLAHAIICRQHLVHGNHANYADAGRLAHITAAYNRIPFDEVSADLCLIGTEIDHGGAGGGGGLLGLLAKRKPVLKRGARKKRAASTKRRGS